MYKINQNRWVVGIVALVMSLGTVLLFTSLFGLVSHTSSLSSLFPWGREASRGVALETTVQQAAGPITGAYSGEITIQGVQTGVYSNTLSLPPVPTDTVPADLGKIALSLQLTQTGESITGYVLLENSLTFTTEHSALIPNQGMVAVGPAVRGSYKGATLTLESEYFSSMVSGREIVRQFRLTSNSIGSNGGMITGDYRETLWGFAIEPSTAMGRGQLARPDALVLADPADGKNMAPVAVNDKATTGQGMPVIIDVLANDADGEGDALSINSVDAPGHGDATRDGNVIVYTPKPDFVGTDTFTYVVADAQGGTAVGTVMVEVSAGTGAGGFPTAVEDRVSTTPGTAVLIDVTANDSDPDGAGLAVSIATTPANASATMNGSKIQYTPKAGFIGQDFFTYTVKDGSGDMASATVFVSVIDPAVPNAAPVAVDDTVTTPPGVAVTIDVLANDSDPDNDPLFATVETQPTNGVATVDNNQIVYTPRAGFSGQESFRYLVVDGKGGSDSATITVRVTTASGTMGSSVYLPLAPRN